MEIKNLVSQEILKDRYLKNGETLEEQIDRIASEVAKCEDNSAFWKDEFKYVLENRLFIPAGRIISAAGIGKKLTLSNCFCLNFVPDSMEGIFDYVKKGALVHKTGGGTGYNFSLIRPNGEPTSNDAIASGVVSFMNVFDAQTKCVNAGSRRGANMGMLSIYHPDIFEYVDAKSFEEDKLTQFNVSVLVDDKFMKAVEDDKEINLIYPCMSEEGDMLNSNSEGVRIYKTVKARELWDRIMTKAYMNGEPGIIFYDNLNKTNNTSYIEKIVACNPCSEYISGVIKGYEDNFGACNLGSLFLHNFVENPFTKDAYLNMDKLTETVSIAVRFLDNVLDVNYYPLDNFKKYQDNMRTIGLGVTGLADMLAMLGVKYSSQEALEYVDMVMEQITYTAYRSSVDLSIEKGAFPLYRKEFLNSNFIEKYKKSLIWNKLIDDISKHGIRNARLISIAPTGSISMAYGENCSSGIEPIFSLEYNRKIHVGGQLDENIQTYKMRDYAYDLWLETEDKTVSKDVFETALSLDVDAHVNMLSVIANHVDMSISKTINIPTEYSFEDTKEVYMKCWRNGINGCTIFRPNEIRQGILIADNKEDNNTKKKNKVEEVKRPLQRGEWEERPKEIIGVDRKVYTGCGKVKLHIKIVPSEKRVFDFYITNSSKGGCRHNIEADVICMSGMLRLGGELDNVEKAFGGCGSCPSFTSARKNGKKISRGSSCPTAILNIVREVEEDLKNETLEELKLIGYYKYNTVGEVTSKEDCIVVDGERVPIKTLEKITGTTYTKVEKVEEVGISFMDQKELDYLKEYGEIAFIKKFHKCPDCGSNKISNGDGCMTCIDCTWTKC